jgi:hypothetical protein
VLGFANGLDAGRVAEAAVLAFLGAAAVTGVVASAIPAVANRSLRIISLPNKSIT